MAARATRSASGAASSSDDASRCLLLALSHDELGVVVDGLADPLQPVVAVALSSTCLGLRTPLQAALEVLKERHSRAVALCLKVDMSSSKSAASVHPPHPCTALRDAHAFFWSRKGLTADDMATLGMILRRKGVPKLQSLDLTTNLFGDMGMQAFCDGLGHATAPSLRLLGFENNQIGPVGAEALATAIGRGAMPKLEWLTLRDNPIGNQGMSALAAPLRKLPALKELYLFRCCNIGDEGVASLVANLGKDDFMALERLNLDGNMVTDTGCALLSRALDASAFPALHSLNLRNNPASEAARLAVREALSRAIARARARVD